MSLNPKHVHAVKCICLPTPLKLASDAKRNWARLKPQKNSINLVTTVLKNSESLELLVQEFGADREVVRDFSLTEELEVNDGLSPKKTLPYWLEL